MENLKLAINYVEKKTGYNIVIKGDGPGKLMIGRTKGGMKIAHIYGSNCTQICHELGHMLATPGIRPISLISMVIRELQAWGAGECLQDKFDIPFDEDCFDEGMGSYLLELLISEECPSIEWISQLIGE